MDTDRSIQEGRKDVHSELSFISAPREADPMPVVTRPSEGNRPEPTSAMVTRSRAREGRGISVASEAQIEPEIETRPEQEIVTCEKGLGAARPFPSDTGSLFTFAEIVTAHTSQEVTETAIHPQDNPIPSPPHTNVRRVEKMPIHWWLLYQIEFSICLSSLTSLWSYLLIKVKKTVSFKHSVRAIRS